MKAPPASIARSGWLRRGIWAAGLSLIAAILIAPPGARADRALLSEDATGTAVEGSCGVASSGSRIYVSSYYQHQVFATSPSLTIATDPIKGPCGLAVSGEALYVNYWHQGVDRLRPSVVSFDDAESTGVAVGADGKVYVNDRTYVAVYEPSGAPVTVAGEGGDPQPLRIGLGSLGDAYGVAVDLGRVYVPDAADHTVKVYEPAVDPAVPIQVIEGPQDGFRSLVDAALAIDPVTHHLVVLDNLQPGYEHPEAALYEFAASGAFLDGISTSLVHGEPSGLSFAGSELLATSGNSEGGVVYRFGSYAQSLGVGGSPPQTLSTAGADTAPAVAAAVIVTAPAPALVPRRSTKTHRHGKHKHRHRDRLRGGKGR